MVKESQPLAKVVWEQEPYFLQLYMAHRSITGGGEIDGTEQTEKLTEGKDLRWRVGLGAGARRGAFSPLLGGGMDVATGVSF